MTGSTLSVAVQAFAQLIAFRGVAFAPGGAPRYKALVVNNSGGVYHRAGISRRTIRGPPARRKPPRIVAVGRRA
mgnify:CR=1 FL=1